MYIKRLFLLYTTMMIAHQCSAADRNKTHKFYMVTHCDGIGNFNRNERYSYPYCYTDGATREELIQAAKDTAVSYMRTKGHTVTAEDVVIFKAPQNSNWNEEVIAGNIKYEKAVQLNFEKQNS